MITTRTRRIVTGTAIAAATAAFSLAGASSASAQQLTSSGLTPGQGTCTNVQYAAFAVRGDALASGDGAKFKLLRNGVVVANTGRVQAWGIELKSANGTFPGPGNYSLCAQNTGTTNTTVTLKLRTDAEV
jgi:hypothetical protein